MGIWNVIQKSFGLGKQVAAPVVEAQPAFFRPHMRPPAKRVSNLPDLTAVGYLVGREGLIGDLRQQLHREKRVHLQPAAQGHYSPGIHRVVYAVGHQALEHDEATAVLTLVAESPLDWRFALAGLAQTVSDDVAQYSSLSLFDQEKIVRNWLQRHSGWLLIIQEVNDASTAAKVLELIEACSHGSFLIAGQHGVPGHAPTVILEELDVAASVELLVSELGNDMRALGVSREALEPLAEQVGGLTTVLEAAVGALRQRRLPWFQVETELSQTRAWFVERQAKGCFPPEFPAMAGGLLRLNLEGLTPAAGTLLHLAAFGADSPVPLWLYFEHQELLQSDHERLTESPFAEADFPVQAAADELRDVMIARLHHERLEFNRMVLDFCRASLSAQADGLAEKWVAGALALITEAAESARRSPQRWSLLRPHAEAVLKFADSFALGAQSRRLRRLLGSYYHRADVGDRANELLGQAREHLEQEIGTAKPSAEQIAELIGLQREQAYLAIDLGNFARAEALLRKVRDQVLDDPVEHPVALHDLAGLARQQGNLADALEMHRQALMLEQENRGREHPAVALRLLHLGETLLEAERISEAESVLRRSLDQLHRAGTPLREDIAHCGLVLAQVMTAEQRFHEAEELLLEVIQRAQDDHGRLSFNTVAPLALLADVHEAMAQWNKAESTLIEYLAVLQRIHGEAHPDVCDALKRLAKANLLQERWRTCRGQLERALRVEETLFGEQSTKLYEVIDLFVELYRINQKEPEMHQYLNRAWTIAHLHPESVSTMPERLRQQLEETFPNHPPGGSLPEDSTPPTEADAPIEPAPHGQQT